VSESGTFLQRFLDLYNANAQFSAPESPIVDENGHLILMGKVYDFIHHTGPISKPFGISEQVVDILRSSSASSTPSLCWVALVFAVFDLIDPG